MAYRKWLHRSREFGTHCPPSNGAYYNQDGFDFDHEGNLCEHLLSKEQKAQLADKLIVDEPEGRDTNPSPAASVKKPASPKRQAAPKAPKVPKKAPVAAP